VRRRDPEGDGPSWSTSPELARPGIGRERAIQGKDLDVAPFKPVARQSQDDPGRADGDVCRLSSKCSYGATWTRTMVLKKPRSAEPPVRRTTWCPTESGLMIR
jgi:hypothetical protein